MPRSIESVRAWREKKKLEDNLAKKQKPLKVKSIFGYADITPYNAVCLMNKEPEKMILPGGIFFKK